MVNIPNGNGTNDLAKMIGRSEGRRPCGCGCKSGLGKLAELGIGCARHPAADDLPLLLCPTLSGDSTNLFVEGILTSDNGT